MKYSDLIKYLRTQGAQFKEGAKHTKVYLNGRQSLCHGIEKLTKSPPAPS